MLITIIWYLLFWLEFILLRWFYLYLWTMKNIATQILFMSLSTLKRRIAPQFSLKIFAHRNVNMIFSNVNVHVMKREMQSRRLYWLHICFQAYKYELNVLSIKSSWRIPCNLRTRMSLLFCFNWTFIVKLFHKLLRDKWIIYYYYVWTVQFICNIY